MVNNKQERRQKQIYGIIKVAALHHWPFMDIVNTQVINVLRTDVNYIDYKRKDGQHEGVMLQFVGVHLGKDQILPVNMGYCASDNVLLVEELDSNYALMLFTIFGETEE